MKKCLLTVLAVLAFIASITFDGWSASSRDVLADLRPALLARFDKDLKLTHPADLRLESHGGRIIDGGVSGRALSLGRKESLKLEARDVINAEEGTILFWVRPKWADSDKSSHTFVSFNWDDKRKSYFVISKGWWEKDGGQPYTYFIFNNADSAKTEKVVSYTKDKWVHIACTWRTGEDGFVRLYANGLLVGQGHKKPMQASAPAGKLYIGADIGSPLSNDRWGDCDLDELAVFKRALQDEDILRIFNTQNPRKYTPRRNAKGQILQTRAIFDEGTGWMTKEGAEATVRRIKKAGFNVYVPCVWHGRGTRYPSSLAPSESNQVFAHDPLAYLLDVAHKNNIEVHPWFTVTLRQRNFF